MCIRDRDISAAQLEEWRRVLNQKGCIVMKDAEEFMTIFQGSEAIARERNIRNVAISTLEIDDVLMGCLGVDVYKRQSSLSVINKSRKS